VARLERSKHEEYLERTYAETDAWPDTHADELTARHMPQTACAAANRMSAAIPAAIRNGHPRGYFAAIRHCADGGKF
jgi:hypothetical protein